MGYRLVLEKDGAAIGYLDIAGGSLPPVVPPVEPPPPPPPPPPVPPSVPVDVDLGLPGSVRPQPIYASIGQTYSVAFEVPEGYRPTLRVQGSPGAWFRYVTDEIVGVRAQRKVLVFSIHDIDLTGVPPGRHIARFFVEGNVLSGQLSVQLF